SRRRWRRTSRSILAAGTQGSPFRNAPTSLFERRRMPRQYFQTQLRHQSTVYPEIGEPPAHDGLQASLDRVTAGLVSESAELPAVLQDVRHSLSVVSAPPTALVRTLRGSRPAR
ncbi:hypothetical protein T4A_2975, partial [Trichinella pseudospiralis]